MIPRPGYLEKLGEDLVELEKNKRKVDYKKFIRHLNTLVSSDEKISDCVMPNLTSDRLKQATSWRTLYTTS